MLYIVGGTSRSGKTMLARRAVVEKQLPYFPLDALFGGLVNGAPQFGLRYEDTLLERPQKIWPISKSLLDFFFQEERDFLIEGDSILPSQVHELLLEGKVIICFFFGYTKLTKDEKFAMVRMHHQGEIDWTKDISDEEMVTMIDEMISFSHHIEEECAKYGFKYFDVSHDFKGVHEAAFEYLFNQ